MTTTTIIPKSHLEKRYEEAKERFNNEYDNRYELLHWNYYLGNKSQDYVKTGKELSKLENDIAKSYTEDAAPEEWEGIREERNNNLLKAAEIYERATALVISSKKRYQEIEDNVRSELIERLGELHYQGEFDFEVDLGDELVDTAVEYFIYDHTRDVKGTYDTPSYVDGVTVVDYTITVYNEDGEREQTIEGKFEI